MMDLFKKNNNLLALLLFFIIICIFFGEQIFTKATFGYSHMDTDANHLNVKIPLRIVLAQEAREGYIPLWNPYLCFGVPFLAYTHIGTFYPLYIFYHFLSYQNAAVVIPIIHMLLGGFFFYLFAKKIKISKFSSLISAITFMICGLNLFLILVHDGGHHSTLAFMPAVFLVIYNMVDNPSLSRGVLLTLIIGLQASIGDFSYIIIEFIGVIPFLLFLILKKYGKTKNLKKIFTILLMTAVFMSLGLLLNGITLLPAKELVENSVRSNGFSDEYRQKYASISLMDVLFFSIIPIYENRHIETQGAFTIYNFFYLGIVPFALYFLSFFSKSRLKSFFSIILPLISLFFVCGYYTPLFYYISFIPILKNMHLFFRFYELFIFAILICLGLGLDVLKNQNPSEYSRKKNIFIKIALSANILIIFLYFKAKFGLFLNISYFSKISDLIFKVRMSDNLVVSLIALSLLSISVLLIYLMRKSISRYLHLRAFWLILLVIWCCYELWRFSQGAFSHVLTFGLFHFIPKLLLISSLISIGILGMCFKKNISYKYLRFAILLLILITFYSFYRSGKPIEKEINFKNETYGEFFKNKQDINRVLVLRPAYPYKRNICSDTAILYQTPALGGEFYLPLKKYIKFINLLVDNYFELKNGQINYWDYTFPYETTDFINKDNIHLLNMANIKYLVVEGFIPKMTVSNKNYTSPFKLVINKDIQIYENKDALDRAYIVHKTRVIQNEEHVLKELKNPEFNYRHYVIIENSNWRRKLPREHTSDYQTHDVIDRDHFDAEGQIFPKNEYAKITEYNMDNLTIEANMLKDGFLVLSETYYPGWKVIIDGRQGRIYRANYLFRGIFLNKGRHKVQFVYKPLSLRLGLIITIISSIILLSMFVTIFILHLRGNKKKTWA